MDISKEQKKQETEEKKPKKTNKKDKELKEKTAEEKKEEETQKEVDSNVKIRVMPRKYKTITVRSGNKKSKMVGFVIIGIGFLVMVALIIGAYFYLIKPQSSTSDPVVVKKVETAKKVEAVKKVEPVKEVEKEVEKEKEEEEENVMFVENISSSTDNITEEASSTDEELVSSSTEEDVVENETVLFIANDSDDDGLYDSEELLLGSDLMSPDSDNDGYDDLSEVLGLYNPINTDKLYANSGISKYENEYLKYSLLYPNSWKMNVVGNNDSVVFAVGDGSFINLLIQPNADNLDILSWLKELLPEAKISKEDVIFGTNWSGVYHENQRIFYLTDEGKNNIFIFDYSPAKEDYLDYYNIFKVMINSFEFED